MRRWCRLRCSFRNTSNTPVTTAAAVVTQSRRCHRGRWRRCRRRRRYLHRVLSVGVLQLLPAAQATPPALAAISSPQQPPPPAARMLAVPPLAALPGQMTIVFFLSTVFAVFSTPYHLFSSPPQLFSTPPNFFSTYPILPQSEQIQIS